MDSHGAAATLITSIPFCSFDFLSPPVPPSVSTQPSAHITLSTVFFSSVWGPSGPPLPTTDSSTCPNLFTPIYTTSSSTFVHLLLYSQLTLLLLPLTRRLTDLDVLLLFFARKSGATGCFCSPATCKQLITIIVCVFQSFNPRRWRKLQLIVFFLRATLANRYLVAK